MSDLHLWMQAWSNQGEKMLVSVERIDKFDNNATAFDCSNAEFRSIEASQNQVLHDIKRTKLVQRTRVQN